MTVHAYMYVCMYVCICVSYCGKFWGTLLNLQTVTAVCMTLRYMHVLSVNFLFLNVSKKFV